MRWVYAVVLLTGCHELFSLEAVTLPPVDAEIEIDASVADRDQDGVVNTSDNCPAIANPDQHDAPDSDGIGSSCDPHPQLPDRIVVQELFEADAPGWIGATNGWTKSPGNWTSPPAAANSGALTYNTPMLLNRPSILVGFTVVAYENTSDLKELVAHLDAPGNDGDCAFRHRDPDTDQIVIHHAGTNQGAGVTEYTIGDSFLGTYTRGFPSRCSVNGESFERNDDTLEQFVATPRIVVDRMQVTLHHVTVFERLP